MSSQDITAPWMFVIFHGFFVKTERNLRWPAALSVRDWISPQNTVPHVQLDCKLFITGLIPDSYTPVYMKSQTPFIIFLISSVILFLITIHYLNVWDPPLSTLVKYPSSMTLIRRNSTVGTPRSTMAGKVMTCNLRSSNVMSKETSISPTRSACFWFPDNSFPEELFQRSVRKEKKQKAHGLHCSSWQQFLTMNQL